MGSGTVAFHGGELQPEWNHGGDVSLRFLAQSSFSDSPPPSFGRDGRGGVEHPAGIRHPGPNGRESPCKHAAELRHGKRHLGEQLRSAHGLTRECGKSPPKAVSNLVANPSREGAGILPDRDAAWGSHGNEP